MKRTLLPALFLLATGVACDDSGTTDGLLPSGAATPPMATDPASPAAGDNTAQHFKESIGGDNGLTDERLHRQDDQATGSPEVVARLHATQKISYAALDLSGLHGFVKMPARLAPLRAHVHQQLLIRGRLGQLGGDVPGDIRRVVGRCDQRRLAVALAGDGRALARGQRQRQEREAEDPHARTLPALRLRLQRRECERSSGCASIAK